MQCSQPSQADLTSIFVQSLSSISISLTDLPWRYRPVNENEICLHRYSETSFQCRRIAVDASFLIPDCFEAYIVRINYLLQINQIARSALVGVQLGSLCHEVQLDLDVTAAVIPEYPPGNQISGIDPNPYLLFVFYSASPPPD